MLNFLQVRKTWIIGDSFYLCVFHLPLWICCTQIKELFKHCCKLNVDQSHEWKKDEADNIVFFAKFYRNHSTVIIFWFFLRYQNLLVRTGMIQTGLYCHEKIDYLERESSKREKSLFLINTRQTDIHVS